MQDVLHTSRCPVHKGLLVISQWTVSWWLYFWNVKLFFRHHTFILHGLFDRLVLKCGSSTSSYSYHCYITCQFNSLPANLPRQQNALILIKSIPFLNQSQISHTETKPKKTKDTLNTCFNYAGNPIHFISVNSKFLNNERYSNLSTH